MCLTNRMVGMPHHSGSPSWTLQCLKARSCSTGRSFFVFVPYFFPRVPAVPQDSKLDEHIVFHLLTMHGKHRKIGKNCGADGSESAQTPVDGLKGNTPMGCVVTSCHKAFSNFSFFLCSLSSGYLWHRSAFTQWKAPDLSHITDWVICQ